MFELRISEAGLAESRYDLADVNEPFWLDDRASNLILQRLPWDESQTALFDGY
jgi:hypothetical protein